jgi:ketosteroid isomerase-like protein
MNTLPAEAESLASRFVEATGARDLPGLAALLAEDARFWTNIANEAVDRATRLARIELEFKLFRSFAFEDARIDGFSDGFVIRALARGSLASGEAFEFPICIVADVRGGLIERLEEYVDAAAVAPILGAMAAAAEG